MLTVGLTGGIASGKSYVLGLLRELGCQTIDADLVAHRVMEPGQPAYDDLVAHFGTGIVGEDGRIDRARLGPIVFADEEQRRRLNAIVHPRIYEAQSEWLRQVAESDPRAIAVIDAALMIETGSYRRFDKVVVVHCAPELQLERLIQRNGLTREAAQARISAQMPAAEKLRYADYSIDTSAGFEDTRRQVTELWHWLQRVRDGADGARQSAESD